MMEDQKSLEPESAFSSPTFEKDGSFKVNKPVGSMSISPCGRDVVLASRQGLHIVDLDSPWAPPRYLSHVTPWEVADVQWSPFPARDRWIVSTSNQKALVWNVEIADPQRSVEHVLHAHTRAITDINFSAHHPDVLATCAVDSFVHCWDLRAASRPFMSFCDWFAGATQVKFSRIDSHIIASSHDRFLRIWDDRKGSQPLRSIEAHDTKIYGIDWNRMQPGAIVTCSLDRTIKFWDYTRESDVPERIIETPFPVWRARHTPFGWGLLAMPQRGDHNLHLYDRRRTYDGSYNDRPTHQFTSHEDNVKEFLWRPRGNIVEGLDHRDFQLVTWGADHMLRLHYMDKQTLKDVGYLKGQSVPKVYNLTRKAATYRTFREEPNKYMKKITSNGLLPVSISSGSNFLGGDEPKMSAPARINSIWEGGGFLNAKRFAQNGSARKESDPIEWMKGVKIGKKEQNLEQSIADITSPNFLAQKQWEDFDNLGEEIAHVGVLFSKVDFNEIDVQHRFVRLSLNGPWAAEHVNIYLDCQIKFPKDYPNGASPIVTIGRTESLDPLTLQTITTDVDKIIKAFKAQQRGCLEALIRYLQGEQSVAEILSWTSPPPDISTLGLDDNGQSSSDEDEDVDPLEEAEIQDFGMTGSGLLSASNANANVPLPKACGALWADNGVLVCFFPPKAKQVQSMVGSLGVEGPGTFSRSKRRGFALFGKFHPTSTSSLYKSRQSSHGTVETDEEHDDYESDSSSGYSSSHSNASSNFLSVTSPHVSSHFPPRADVLTFLRLEDLTNDGDRSASVAALSVSRPDTVARVKNVVSLHDLADMLPVNRTLAKQYKISGPNACSENAKLALAVGKRNLSDAWTFLGLLLQPMRLSRREFLRGSIASTNAKRRDSGTDLTYDSELTHQSNPFTSTGPMQSSGGAAEHVERLFEHFETLADIQMLAVMSCVLSPYRRRLLPEDDLNDGVDSKTTRGRLDHFNKSFNFTDSKDLAGVFSSSDPLPPKNVEFGVLRIRMPSETPSLDLNTSGPVTPLSGGVTPPLSYIVGRRGFFRSNSAISDTGPPTRTPTYAEQHLSSTFASSFSRSFTFSVSGSPSTGFQQGSSSPLPSLDERTTTPERLRTKTSMMARSFSTSDEHQPLNVTFDVRRADRSAKEKPRFTIHFTQASKSSRTSAAPSPLDPKKESQYQAYRAAYAEILDVWNLNIRKVQILNFNALNKTPVQPKKDAVGRHPATDGESLEVDHSLSVRVCCQVCSTPAEISSIVGSTCQTCEAKLRHQICVLCEEPVQGTSSACLNCGHVLHTACRTEITDAELPCPSGCECFCARYQRVAVEWPEEQRNSRSSAPSTIRDVEELETSPTESYRMWEQATAFKSLAGNLADQSRVLRPKGSAIWTRKGRY